MKEIKINRKNHDRTEVPAHLSQEDGSQTKRATTITAQEEQANKHDYSQDQVGKDRRD
jgi:hypothetical protein